MGEKVASIAMAIVVLAAVGTLWANPGGTAQIFEAGGKVFTNSISAAKH